MSVKIKLKHSSVANKAPLPTDLDNGELALNTNTASPAAYIKDSAGNIVKLAGAGAIGGTAATETAAGIVELATAAETEAGTDNTRAVHPAGLKATLDAHLTPGTSTPPAAPTVGATYINTAVTPAVLNVWSGTAWVPQVGTAIAAGTAPATPATGQIWVDTSGPTPVNKVWDGTSWVVMTVDTGTQAKLDAQVASIWNRTGTVLSPAKAGDAVDIDFPLGTAALPGLTPVGDPNTGIYSPGADQIGIATNGVGRVFVNAAGFVGIKTSTPVVDFQLNAASDVTLALMNSSPATSGNRGSISCFNSDVSSVGAIRFAAATDNVGTEIQFFTRPAAGAVTQHTMTLDSTGRLGVGPDNTNPVASIDIKGSDASILIGDAGRTQFWRIQNNETDDALVINANDTSERVRVDASGKLLVGTSSALNASTAKLQCATTANITTTVYADNTAALAGGLVAGDIYRKADGTLMITF